MSFDVRGPYTIRGDRWVLWFTTELDPPFTVWLDDIRVATLREEHQLGGLYWTIVDTDQTGILTVMQGMGPPPMPYPARVTLAWYRSDGAHHYRVDQYVDDAWEMVDRIPGARYHWVRHGWYLTWRSARLHDAAQVRYRVVPEAAQHSPGAAVELETLMVRHPDPPAPTYSYDDETGLVTVA